MVSKILVSTDLLLGKFYWCESKKMAFLTSISFFLQQLFCLTWIQFLIILLNLTSFWKPHRYRGKRKVVSLGKNYLPFLSEWMRPWNSVLILHPASIVGDLNSHKDLRAEPFVHNYLLSWAPKPPSYLGSSQGKSNIESRPALPNKALV